MVAVPDIAVPVIPVAPADVQLKFTTAVGLVSVTGAVVSPEQMVWLAIENCTTGEGLTVIVKV